MLLNTFQKKIGMTHLAVLDGIIPKDKFLSPNAMLEESRKALEKWIDRLENNID